MAGALVEVGLSTAKLRRICRAVAKHLTALADDLEEIEGLVLDADADRRRDRSRDDDEVYVYAAVTETGQAEALMRQGWEKLPAGQGGQIPTGWSSSGSVFVLRRLNISAYSMALDPQDVCKVGDPDPTPDRLGVDEACGARDLGRGLLCSRRPHQLGQHVAGGGRDGVLAVWR